MQVASNYQSNTFTTKLSSTGTDEEVVRIALSFFVPVWRINYLFSVLVTLFSFTPPFAGVKT